MSHPGEQQVTVGAVQADAYRHEAVLYRGDDGFAEALAPFVADAVEAGEAVLVAVGPAKADLLRQHLGSAWAAVQVAGVPDGSNPARLLAVWRAFLAEHAGTGRRLRGVAETFGVARRQAERRECELHEGLLNVAVDPSAPFWLRCGYDTSTLEPADLALAERTHPHLLDGAAYRTSDAYEPKAADRALATPLPAVPTGAEPVSFDAPSLARLRALVADRARRAGIPEHRLGDAVLAVDELATNSIRHGGGAGTLWTWTEDDHFLVEVADAGRLRDPLAGRFLPPIDQGRGRGLFIANQLADLVQIHSGEDGTAVRLHLRR